jgi:hypothetical protein
MCDLDVYTYLY